MKVYLTYFRYDRGENYSIYHLDTNLKRSLKSWCEDDLPNFLGYGPDDVSQLYLSRCNLTKSELEVIKNFMESSKEYDKEFYELMNRINDDVSDDDMICCTSGDEVWEVLEFLCENCRYYPLYSEVRKYLEDIPFDDEDELKEVLQEVLFENDDLWDKVLKMYISSCY